MLKELIKLANELDAKGLQKEADALDEIINELGDFSNLDDTNITKDEAFQAGVAICDSKEEEEGDHLNEAIRIASSNAGLQQALEADRQRESDYNRARELETDAQAVIDAGKKELTPVQDTVVTEVVSKLAGFTSAYGLGSSELMFKARGILSPGAIQTLKSLTRVSVPAGLRLAGWIGIAVLIYTYLLSPEAEKNRETAITELKALAEEIKEFAYKLGLNPL